MSSKTETDLMEGDDDIFVNISSIQSREELRKEGEIQPQELEKSDELLMAVQMENECNADIRIAPNHGASSSYGSLSHKFNGPAGLKALPKLAKEDWKYLSQRNNPISKQVDKILNEAVSSSDNFHTNAVKEKWRREKSKREFAKLFDKNPCWDALLNSLELSSTRKEAFIKLATQCNIKRMCSRIFRTGLPGNIPFLIGSLKGVSFHKTTTKKAKAKSSNFVIADLTGELNVAVDRKFLTAFGQVLENKSAIILQNCGVIKFKKNILLRATISNVISIATMSDKPVQLQSYQPMKRVFYESGAVVHQLQNMDVVRLAEESRSSFGLPSSCETEGGPSNESMINQEQQVMYTGTSGKSDTEFDDASDSLFLNFST